MTSYIVEQANIILKEHEIFQNNINNIFLKFLVPSSYYFLCGKLFLGSSDGKISIPLCISILYLVHYLKKYQQLQEDLFNGYYTKPLKLQKIIEKY